VRWRGRWSGWPPTRLKPTPPPPTPSPRRTSSLPRWAPRPRRSSGTAPPPRLRGPSTATPWPPRLHPPQAQQPRHCGLLEAGSRWWCVTRPAKPWRQSSWRRSASAANGSCSWATLRSSPPPPSARPRRPRALAGPCSSASWGRPTVAALAVAEGAAGQPAACRPRCWRRSTACTQPSRRFPRSASTPAGLPPRWATAPAHAGMA
jgi:hypothetical protein